MLRSGVAQLFADEFAEIETILLSTGKYDGFAAAATVVINATSSLKDCFLSFCPLSHSHRRVHAVINRSGTVSL